jgi:phenylalanine ammonia-lyase
VHGIDPISLESKEHLGILNGTAFSTSVAALALNDALHLALLAQVCAAMGTEALLGSRGSFDPFIHEVARPHPGQVSFPFNFDPRMVLYLFFFIQIEAARNIWDLLEDSKFAEIHENDVAIESDQGILRQDRYPLRTAPQFLGPQIEDILTAFTAVTQECNSSMSSLLPADLLIHLHHSQPPTTLSLMAKLVKCITVETSKPWL